MNVPWPELFAAAHKVSDEYLKIVYGQDLVQVQQSHEQQR